MMVEGWMVLTLTNSPFWVGAVAGVRGASVIAFSPVAGVIVDRLDRKKLLVATHILSAAVAFVLAFLNLSGHILLWEIFILSFLQGTALTLNLPTRLTLAMDVVGKERLLNANAANYLAYGLMQVLIPSVGGVAISKSGVGVVYLLIGAGFLAAAFLSMKIVTLQKMEHLIESVWQNLKEGVRYASGNSSLRLLLLVVLVVNAFGWSYYVMLPVMARDVLKVGATGFGFIATASGIGYIAGTLTIGALGGLRSSGWMLVIGCTGFGVFLAAFALSPWFVLSMLLLIGLIAFATTFDSVMATQLQLLSADNMRGRVMSFYSLTTGMIMLGGFPSGAVASFWGAPIALAINGGILVLNALLIVRLLPMLQQKDETKP